ncbi:MAG TPA: sugar-binding domain-containing protein [Rhizobium sp.]
MDDDRIAKLNFLADVAEALLVEGLTQQEAATRFNLSRPSISRLLNEAREQGLVKVEIKRIASEYIDLASEISERYAIARVHVAGIANSDISDHFAHYSAERVAEYLKAGTVLGITLGTTLGKLIYQLARMDPKQISVVQLCGSVGTGSPMLDSHSLVAHLAQAYGANSLHLHAPYAVETAEMRDMLNDHPANRLCLELGRKADVALVGVGTITPRFSSLHLGGHQSTTVMQSFQDAGAVGDVAGFFFDHNGQPLRVDRSKFWKTGLDVDEFMGIPHRIGVAASPHKASAIIASLKGGWINEIITDRETAEAILNQRD